MTKKRKKDQVAEICEGFSENVENVIFTKMVKLTKIKFKEQYSDGMNYIKCPGCFHTMSYSPKHNVYRCDEVTCDLAGVVMPISAIELIQEAFVARTNLAQVRTAVNILRFGV